MTKHTLQAISLFFLCMLIQLLLVVPTVQAAPGNYLLQFGAPQHLTDAAGVAVDTSGKIYVTETGNFQVFNSSGVRLGKFGSYGSGNGQLSYPTGIAVDGSGNVFIADTGNSRIEVFNSNGGFVRAWGNANWAQHPPIAVAVDYKGQVYVVEAGWYDANYNYFEGGIKVFNSSGVFLRELGSAGSGAEQYSRVSGIAVDKNANVYVLDAGHSRVLLFGASGNFIKIAVAGTVISDGIAVDNAGNIYVAGGTPYYFGVDIYDSTGTFVREQTWFSDQESLDEEHYWVPKAVAVDANQTMYTLDYYDDGLRAFAASGATLPQWWTYGAGLGQMSSPVGIALDASGNVYETDADNPETPIMNNRVQVFGPNGTPLARWVGSFCQTSGITISGGNVYVLDTTDPSGMVGCDTTIVAQIFNTSGTPAGSFGTGFVGQNFFGIAVDSAGNFVVTDTGNSTLRLYDRNGNFLRTVGSQGTGNGQFMNPKGVAVDGSGNIYVADSGNNRIEVFNSSYTFIRKWGGGGSATGYFSNPAGIAVDKTGHVFVADSGNNRIQVFNTSGSFLAAWGTLGDLNGQFVAPAGVAVNGAGTRVYVADTGNNRIEVFEGFGSTGYTISGTVRVGSSTGPVLAGATVSVAGQTTTTNSVGSFSIAGIPAGTYTLTISKSGYVTRTITGFVISGNRSGLVYYLAPTYSISGTVRVGSSTGAVLAGATVSIAGKTATTSSTGTFTISGIAAGSYTLTISKPGYVTKTITSYYINSNKTGLVFYLTAQSGYTISGTVHQGSTSGPVVAGATVTIGGKTTTTSSTGTFTVTALPSGTYAMTISKAGYVTKSITLVINGNMSGLSYYLLGPYWISGTVRQGGSTGPVLAGATVSIASRSATTSSTGTFTVTGIPAGTYTLTISKAGYVTKTVTGFAVTSSRTGLVFYLTQ